MNLGITTKAAVCPNCKKYHLIASVASFEASRETREDFATMMIDGYSIIETTTHDAKKNFGISVDGCP